MADLNKQLNEIIEDKTLASYDRNHMIQMIIMDENKKSNAKFLMSLLEGHSYYLCCDTCFTRHANAWGGAAMTSWNCARCGGGQLSGSTAHATICTGCAMMTKKCIHCNYNDNNIKELISHGTNV